jgi:hypothetical protein
MDRETVVKDFCVKLSCGEVQVIIEKYVGLAVSGATIIVPPNDVPSKEYFDTMVHETLHTSLPDMTESEVERVTQDIVEVLWKRGYRLPAGKKKRKE